MELEVRIEEEGGQFKATFVYQASTSDWAVGATKGEAFYNLLWYHGDRYLDQQQFKRTWQAACTHTDETHNAIGEYLMQRSFRLGIDTIRE